MFVHDFHNKKKLYKNMRCIMHLINIVLRNVYHIPKRITSVQTLSLRIAGLLLKCNFFCIK